MTGNSVSLHVRFLGGPNLWRLGLQALLRGRPNLTRVTQAPDLAQVVEPPDVFMLDGRVADDLVSPLLASFSQTRLLVITDELSESAVLAWLERGVLGCIERDASLPELLNAFRQVATGEVSLPQATALRLVARMDRQTPSQEDALPEPLSSREQEVLTLLAEGLSNKDIA